jgi:hypothetical protein
MLMDTYRAAWRNAALVVGGVGILIALVRPETGVNAAVSASVGLTAGVFTFLVQEAREDPRHRRQALTAGAGVSAATFGIAGLAALDGQLTLLFVTMFILASPPALRSGRAAHRRLVARSSRTCSDALTSHVTTEATDETSRSMLEARPATTLTDTELCSAWTTSSAEFDRARRYHDTAQQVRLANTRQGYLDELERRDPTAFQRWLAAGVDRNIDPSEFFRRPAQPAPTHEGEPPRDPESRSSGPGSPT